MNQGNISVLKINPSQRRPGCFSGFEMTEMIFFFNHDKPSSRHDHGDPRTQPDGLCWRWVSAVQSRLKSTNLPGGGEEEEGVGKEGVSRLLPHMEDKMSCDES